MAFACFSRASARLQCHVLSSWLPHGVGTHAKTLHIRHHSRCPGRRLKPGQLAIKLPCFRYSEGYSWRRCASSVMPGRHLLPTLGGPLLRQAAGPSTHNGFLRLRATESWAVSKPALASFIQLYRYCSSSLLLERKSSTPNKHGDSQSTAFVHMKYSVDKMSNSAAKPKSTEGVHV